MNRFLDQMRPFFDDNERRAIFNYDFENAFITEFKETNRFEKALALELGIEDTVAVNNGTVALSIAALAVGVGAEHEVIVPNYTMIATPNAVRMIGAKPVFADIELSTWCIDIDQIFQKVSNKTKAVILVSANGRYPTYDVDELRNTLNKRGIYLIEDAAQSLGSDYADGSKIGTKGNISTLSFSAPKIISTGQGGLIFSQDPELIKLARSIKDFGRLTGGTDEHPLFGINAKFTDLQALIGLEQLKKLPGRIKRRKQQHELFAKQLQECNHVHFVDHNLLHTTPWFTDILVDFRNELIEFLKTKSIGTRIVYPEINKQKIYLDTSTHLSSAKISSRGLWLPSHMGITNDDIFYICEQIKDFYDKNRQMK